MGGGIASDWANTRWAMPGRLWAHFISLFGQAVFLFLFGCVTSDMGWPVALVVLIIFSCFVNAAEGTSYGIVPYMIPQDLAIVLATHFHDNFGVDLVAAGALAMSFGAMNLFARSLGGIFSDWANARWQMQGRL